MEILFEQIKFEEGTAEWTEEQKHRVKSVIEKYLFLFGMNSLDLGRTDLIKHQIKLKDYTPIKDRYCRIPPHQYEEVRKHLKEMLDIGAIRRSSSPWASPVVLVCKKDGSLRFCIDLRKLNARTVKDAYSLPRIEDALDSLNGACIFTSLDLKSGYWQVELDEESIPLTAFTVGPLGFYECVRMPFGLTNAPATFQRLMESCLGELHLDWCIIYLDDIIIFSRTPDDHITRLEGVLEKLAKAGLKLKPSKCELFRSSLKYLGHIVSKDGIATDPRKIEAIRNWPHPKTVTDIRSFTGFTNYYRKFIKGYAKIARPLHELTSGDNAKRKNQKVDEEFGVTFPKTTRNTMKKYVQSLQQWLQWAYEIAKEHIEKEVSRRKLYYDRKVHCMDIIPGDIVLGRQKVFGTQHKIEDRWELPVYKVIEQCGDNPLYKVQKIGGVEGEDVRVLHRNMLFSFIGVRETDEDNTEEEVRCLPEKSLLDPRVAAL